MYKKYKKSILTILIILCSFLFITRTIPLLLGCILSLKSYSPIGGILKSPWVGFKNYDFVFISKFTFNAYINAIRLNIISLLFAIPISGLFVYSTNRINNKNRRIIFSMILSIPAIFPTLFISNCIISSFGVDITNYHNLLYSIPQALN